MNVATSWADLRAALCDDRLKAEGADGFEGLLTALFTAETGERFYLARRGDQPVGDAYSLVGGTILQAKRYREASINANNVEGEISNALREAPVLDVFVVAATRTDAQLRARLARKAQETGLDIVFLELSDTLSDLGALCVKHWTTTRKFLPWLGCRLDAWATGEAGAIETRDALQQLEGQLHGRVSRGVVSKLATGVLSRRFASGVTDPGTHNRVNLAEAVARPAVNLQLTQWWTDPDGTDPAVLLGEEGTGKTWVAATFAAQSLPATFPDCPVVLWVDSLAWGQTRTVEALTAVAIGTLLPPKDARVERLQRKLLSLWTEPVLLVLDGANERGAWTAAEHLLSDYARMTGDLRRRLRLLFTSRPPENRPNVPRRLWAGCAQVQVGPFEDEEFTAALNRFTPGLTPADFTTRVREYARLPRYFHLCVRLRDRLASLDHLTIPLLIWSDLLDKLERGDPQWCDIGRETGARAEEVLAELARGVGWPRPERSIFVAAELERLVPTFRRVRGDLADQRVVTERGLGEFTLSADHVVVGWALVLRHLAARHAGEGFDAVTEQLERVLEPAAANDDKVRAVHLAALLTFLEEGSASESAATADRQDRAALVAWWAGHHNAVASVEQLGFFVGRDLPAYATAVEMLFRQHLPGDLETALVAPLARAWRDAEGDAPALRKILERWLRLIYPGDASGSKERNKTPPARFGAAATREQLRLTYAAVSIVSLRPVREMLPVLADCHHSTSFCYEDHPTATGEGDPFRVPVKSTMEPLGAVLRWRFTEEVLPDLAQMANDLPANADELENLHWFARLFRQAQVPERLGPAEDYVGWQERPPRSIENLDMLRSFLAGAWEADRHEPIGFGHLKTLAVRRDLPDLPAETVGALLNLVRVRLADGGRTLTNDAHKTDHWDDLLPWLARFAPEEFGAGVRTLWEAALGSTEALTGFLYLDEMIPATDPGGQLTDLVVSRSPMLTASPEFTFLAAPLTMLVLLHGSLQQVMMWLRALQESVLERSESPVVCLLPLPEAFAGFAPAGLAEAARGEFEAARLAGMTAVSTEERLIQRRRARHWLQVLSYVAEATPAVVGWALDLADIMVAENDEELSFALLCLVTRSQDAELLRRAVLHPCFREYHTGRNSGWWTCEFPESEKPALRFDALDGKVSLTVAGRLLWANGRDEELRLWGRALASRALAVLRAGSPDVGGGFGLQVRVSEDGSWLGCGVQPLPDGGKSWRSTGSPAWGIDRRESQPSRTQEDADRQLDRLHAALPVWREPSRREFMEFNAAGPLRRWSELDSKRFTVFAEEFLETVWREGVHEVIELSFFASVLVGALLRIDPTRALRFAEHQSGGLRVQVLTFDKALAWGTLQVWDAGLNASPAIQSLRERWLMEARDDEALLWQALAAHGGSNKELLRRLAEGFLAMPLARERALGVSLLAFDGDAVVCARLAALEREDASFWVREHARWAHEVCATELACRDRYRAALRAVNLEELAIQLAQIRTAASPMAYAWHGAVEREMAWMPDGRTATYVAIFWERWGSPSSRTERIKLGGRELRNFCRGESLADGVHERQAPWWQP